MRGRSSRSISAFWISSDSCDGRNRGFHRSHRKCRWCTFARRTANALPDIPPHTSTKRSTAANWNRTNFLKGSLVGRAPLPRRLHAHEMLVVSSGYSKPCCQVVQPETAADRYLRTQTVTSRVVTRHPRRDTPKGFIGK